MNLSPIFAGIEHTAAYFVLGLIVLVLGRRVFDWLTPYNLDHEVAEKNNVAAGITEAGFYIALALITHAAVAGTPPLGSFYMEMASAVIFFLIGLIALAVGRWVLHRTVPFSIDKEVVEDQNVAVGVVEAGFYIALAILIHCAVS
ncbi:MAG: DUF350 domain-containing protein [Candidatus Latescibacteria bacterium]|nr:DUF350 domain-containing protein [Candidatus Latescibacterota bacterium]